MGGGWTWVVSGVAFLGVVIKLVVDALKVRKLRLEIAELRRRLENDTSSPITVATLQEIAEYARKNPSPYRLEKMLRNALHPSEAQGASAGLTAELRGDALAAVADLEQTIRQNPAVAHSLFAGFLAVVVVEMIALLPFAHNPARRAILVGAILGLLATGLRIILGRNGPYMSEEE